MNYYIGLALSSGSSMDSGVAVLDEDNNLITVDKLYKMDDIMFFFDNFPSLKESHIAVSLAWDRTMLEGKWRVLGKPYQMVSTNENMPNRDNWTQRYSTRGSDYFKSLTEKVSGINRFELYLTRQSMNLNSGFLERSSGDCKFLQQTLKLEWGLDLPQNMMPMSQLEAIVGALLAKENAKNPDNVKVVSQFRDLNVIDVTLRPSVDIFEKPAALPCSLASNVSQEPACCAGRTSTRSCALSSVALKKQKAGNKSNRSADSDTPAQVTLSD